MLPYGDKCCQSPDHTLDPLPRISIIIQYFKMPINIPILSLWKQCKGVELIVNVDSRDDGDLQWLKTNADSIVFSNNVHEIRAYNRLARFSRAPIVAFVQDDRSPFSSCGYIDHLETMFSDDVKLAIVGLNVVTTTPKNFKYGQYKHTAYERGTHIWRWNIIAEYAANVDVGPFIARRSAFMILGGFDESISDPGKPGMDLDFELSCRAWLNGFHVALYDFRASGMRLIENASGPSGRNGLRNKADGSDRRKEKKAYVDRKFALMHPHFLNITLAVIELNRNKGSGVPKPIFA